MLKRPNIKYDALILGLPGLHNVENALACIALCHALGAEEEAIREGLKTFRGVKRRFETLITNDKVTYIDDYAHHPTAIATLVKSVRMMHPTKNILGIFQPHLFTRTRDFMDGFARELSELDECVLMPIYPARETPILGITSEALASKISKESKILQPHDVVRYLKNRNNEVVITIGAGDIDRLVHPIKKTLSK